MGGARKSAPRGLRAARVSLVDPAMRDVRRALEVEVKIRYRHPAVPAMLKMVAEDRAEVGFARENPAVTPGQACVFYRGDEVLGGGIIEGAMEN